MNEQTESPETILLTLCGLRAGDFCRLRDVFRDGNILYVSTRENGVGGRSVDAIRNQNYVSSRIDEGDSTYEWYEFQIPTESEEQADAIRRANHAEEMRIDQATCQRPALPRVQSHQARLEDVAAASANKRLGDCSMLELAARLTVSAARLAELVEKESPKPFRFDPDLDEVESHG